MKVVKVSKEEEKKIDAGIEEIEKGESVSFEELKKGLVKKKESANEC